MAAIVYQSWGLPQILAHVPSLHFTCIFWRIISHKSIISDDLLLHMYFYKHFVGVSTYIYKYLYLFQDLLVAEIYLVSEINSKSMSWKLKVRIVRLWKNSDRKDLITLFPIEIILMD